MPKDRGKSYRHQKCALAVVDLCKACGDFEHLNACHLNFVAAYSDKVTEFALPLLWSIPSIR